MDNLTHTLTGLVLGRAGLDRTTRGATLALGLVLSYAGARAVLHAQAVDEVAARVPEGRVLRAAALPTPLDPFRWRVLADTGDAYWTGEVRLGARPTPLRRRVKQQETEAVARARDESEVASIFLAFSRFPWLEVEPTPEGTAVTWTDLRFEYRGRDSFMTRVVVGPDGTLESEDLPLLGRTRGPPTATGTP